MARTNIKATPPSTGTTHEGASAARINAEKELRRSVLSCLLWENEFYEDGEEIGQRILRLAQEVTPAAVADLAIKARSEFKLRHAPLWLCVALARRGALKADVLTEVIQRADELSEFLALYWKDGKVPLAAQAKKGLAAAFGKFDAYQISKYDRANTVRLRDVLFLTNAKPRDEEQEAIWKQLVEGTLPAPDTWEVALSGGADKRETWESLLAERKLGYMALLRNLRNMQGAGVNEDFVFDALAVGAAKSKALPFRFIAAARAVPQWEPQLEQAMLTVVPEQKLAGKTLLLVDVSGSMNIPLSTKSDMRRMEAACGVAMLAREMCEAVEIYAFSENMKVIPPRRGFALRDAIVNSMPHSSTYLGASVAKLNTLPADRMIVITDEQSHDAVPNPTMQGYLINVASNRRGVGYGAWTHIDGFSEAVLDYIAAAEEVPPSQ